MSCPLLEALDQVAYPGYTRSLVSFGLVKQTQLKDGKASVVLRLTTADASMPAQIESLVRDTLEKLDGVRHIEVDMQVEAPPSPTPPAPPQPKAIEGITHTLAIASGKGGVGKSTFSVNLACAFAHLLAPQKTGLIDCDFYGPSVPTMLGIRGEPELVGQDKLKPMENFEVKAMSMGLLVDDDVPIVWRGPMVGKAIRQFIDDVQWGELEILLADLPPGTGDVQLSLAQSLHLQGALIITTPQLVASQVASRGARLFEKVHVPLLGVVENMSTPSGGEALFGEGGGEATAHALKIPFLGSIPLDKAIRQGGDVGVPIVVGDPQGTSAQSFIQIARKILKLLKALPDQEPNSTPPQA